MFQNYHVITYQFEQRLRLLIGNSLWFETSNIGSVKTNMIVDEKNTLFKHQQFII